MSTVLLNTLKKPLFIAGPCSAESPEQLHEVARELKDKNSASIMRAGIWKPRTRPSSFEGVGQEGLTWLKEVETAFNLPVITEVATAQHVEQVLKAGIKNLWIGARTTVNPFTVQDIVDVLKGENVMVLVKNPIHADINLWLGSIERFINAGIENVGAVHRGFSSFMNSEYRNMPMWNIPIELKRRMPGLPVICDPSHIGGAKGLVPRVAQKAMDLNMQGLMVEVHPDPPNAKSDPQQQLTPADYNELIENLLIRKEKPDNPELLDQLEELRNQIDKIDEDLLSTITSRLELIRSIGEHKLENNISVFQLERWNEILRSRGVLGDKLGLSQDFIKSIMELVHQESIRIQTDINSKI